MLLLMSVRVWNTNIGNICVSSRLFICILGPTWSNKTSKAFFRGRDSREERLNLVTMSKQNPELLDAGITAYFFFRDREKDLGKAPLVGFFDFFKVKKTLNVCSKMFFLENTVFDDAIFLVQIPGECRWDGSCLQVSLFDAGQQFGPKAGFTVL